MTIPQSQYGYNVSALMRGYLNLAGIPWKECERLGKEFDNQISSAQWLNTDNGTSFDRAFDPKTAQANYALGKG